MLREIDELLLKSIKLINKTTLLLDERRNIIWNLENIPEMYKFDAGGFAVTETDKDFNYQVINPFKIAETISQYAHNQASNDLIYDWSALLLNFWQEYFYESSPLTILKDERLVRLKSIYHEHDFSSYNPIHVTLTIYPEGNRHFSKRSLNSLSRNQSAQKISIGVMQEGELKNIGKIANWLIG